MLLLAINTVLSILQVEKYLDARDNNEIQHGSRVNATIAGLQNHLLLTVSQRSHELLTKKSLIFLISPRLVRAV